jgi:triosephosphate isomerase
MLADAGCGYVIVGHSERRHILKETDEQIARKVQAGLAGGLTVILCVGETLEERQAASTHAVLDSHVTHGLAGVAAGSLGKVVIAYEPVWAIGTGHTATPDQAQEAHAFLRQRLGQIYGPAAAAGVSILYGGSVKPDNARELFRQPDVDGGLIGGASLKADSFLAIVQAAG